MTMRGVGNAAQRGGERGDVHVVFEVADDPRFERDGEDLYTEVLVTYPQLVLGATLDGADGHVERGAAASRPERRAASVFHLRGRGLPRVNSSGTGDLHVRVQLWTPEKLSPEEEQLIERLAKVQQSVPADRGQGLLGEDEGSAGRVSWLAVRVSAGRRRETPLLAALFELGSLGVQEVGDDLVTHFPDDVAASDVIGAVQRAAPGSTVATSHVAAVDWSEEWKKGVGAHDLGALAIVPPWLAEGRDPARTVVIEPEMAFGTGEHETTRGVVRLLPGRHPSGGPRRRPRRGERRARDRRGQARRRARRRHRDRSRRHRECRRRTSRATASRSA